jgi:hypothetical protein
MNENNPLDPRTLHAYSRPEVAQMFNVTPNTINNWLNEGRFRMKSGEPVAWKEREGLREWFIVAEAVERLLEATRLISPQTPVTIAKTELDTITVYAVIYGTEDVNVNEPPLE